MLWAIFSYHIMHTRTPGGVFKPCNISTPLLQPSAPPSPCCLIVSIHVRQLYLKPSPPPNLQGVRLPLPLCSDSALEMFICTSLSLSLCCFRVTGLSSFVVVAVNFVVLVICRSAKLEFCTVPRTQEFKKKKKKGKEGSSKDKMKW